VLRIKPKNRAYTKNTMEYNIYMSPEFRDEVKRDLKIKEKANVEIKDTLAIERTSFANERTFLAYMRTALSLIVAGFSLHQFFKSDISMWLAGILIPAGLYIGYKGYLKFVKKRALIKRKRDAYVPAKQMLALLKAERAQAEAEEKNKMNV
jgi:putative membrane protein